MPYLQTIVALESNSSSVIKHTLRGMGKGSEILLIFSAVLLMFGFLGHCHAPHKRVLDGTGHDGRQGKSKGYGP